MGGSAFAGPTRGQRALRPRPADGPAGQQAGDDHTSVVQRSFGVWVGCEAAVSLAKTHKAGHPHKAAIDFHPRSMPKLVAS
jgi:hypothetical protein